MGCEELCKKKMDRVHESSSYRRLQRPKRLQLDLLAREFEPDHGNQVFLKPFPGVSVEVVAEFTEVVHLAPTVPAPFAARHVDHKVAIILVVVDARVHSVIRAGPVGEAVDLPLREERGVLANPRLSRVELFQSILLLVFPLHMLLFVRNWVPPDIQQSVSPVATSHEERSQVEPRAVLWQNEVDRVWISIPLCVLRRLVEVVPFERMRDVEGVVLVDVAVDVLVEVVEDMVL